jgi:error-prone DNA polymerase
MAEYAELHAHTNYSFKEGASFPDEMALRAVELGYRALAITDHDNLVGAMEYAQAAKGIDLHAITGAEVTLEDRGHLTLLASTQQGYSNLCRLISFAHVLNDHLKPGLDIALLAGHATGLILLTGCANGPVPRLLMEGKRDKARATFLQYQEWFGPGNVYLELQQNLVYGDTERIKRLAEFGHELGVPLVATNNVHFHVRERHRLQDALVAIRHNKSLEEVRHQLRPNTEAYLKSPGEMAELFRELPEAISNTVVLAERCEFNLTSGLSYRFPGYPVPEGYNPLSYLERLCREAAVRRYGTITDEVEARLQKELRLIDRHELAGFFLIYREIIQIAHDVQADLGLVEPETPIEASPPGRGRGSSVAMLVGYLIGLSHIDPLCYNLSLERFLPDENMPNVPDIDLDFPRNIREELIKRVHARYGWDHAALTGMISTYKLKGAVRDLGKALGLPSDEVDKLAKRSEHAPATELQSEMEALPEFRHRLDTPGWRELVDLAAQLNGFPKYLAQHPGGMVISSTPLIDQVPVQQAAMEGRYICHWDKNSIAHAKFVKIDFLALGALSQMQRAVRLIQERTGQELDLSRIDFEDQEVYEMLHRADTIGIFQVESAAQIQTIPRIRPRNLVDMAHEVAAVRPGVGANDGVAHYIHRRNRMERWDYDHPLEERALGRTFGIILFQDQVNQVAMDVGGFSAVEADQLRRAFGNRRNEGLLKQYWEKFRDGAGAKDVPPGVALRIFKKFNGQYMFPESHAFAFGVTAYQASWLKRYYPLEFYIGLFNEQPMGFYNLETLKEDAKRHGITVLNPCVNRSNAEAVIEGESIRLGLLHVRRVGESQAGRIVAARDAWGAFGSLAEVMERAGVQREMLDNLADAGAFADFRDDRRAIRWEIGLRYRPMGAQLALTLPVEQDMVELPGLSAWEVMEGEYRTMGVHPKSHVMAHLRPQLGGHLSSLQVGLKREGGLVTVSGMVIRRQHPLAEAVFITLEDEFGHVPLIVWAGTYKEYRLVLREPFLVVEGYVSRREGTLNVVVTSAKALDVRAPATKAKDWS